MLVLAVESRMVVVDCVGAVVLLEVVKIGGLTYRPQGLISV